MSQIQTVVDLAFLSGLFPDLRPDVHRRCDGASCYSLDAPALPFGRELSHVELVLPRGFPDHASAEIRLAPDAVLRVPHVESSGKLCITGDPGPGCGLTATERVHTLLLAYHEQFLDRWAAGDLDGDFAQESQNYWVVNVARQSMRDAPVSVVWTIGSRPARPAVSEGMLVLPARIVVAAEETDPFARRLLTAIGARASQRIRVLIAEIPVSHPLLPGTWPKTSADLDRILGARLKQSQRARFLSPIRRRGSGRVHRIVIFRGPDGGFAYLLPGGPPAVLHSAGRTRTRPPVFRPLPLQVDRMDVGWTAGRDQIGQVAGRQKKHVLVLGAGALGSSVIDHLAKAGVGKITIVDPDDLEPANVGRHLLGAEDINVPKASAVASRVGRAHPSCDITPARTSAQRWLTANTLADVDVVLDLTGEHGVRWHVDQARRLHPCPLLIGWMEPYVAAAHACILPETAYWIANPHQPVDRLENLQSVDWPESVIRQVPGCSSRFQAYTAAHAAYAVALVAENAIRLVDAPHLDGRLMSWVRGQKFLDECWPGLALRDWAAAVASDSLGVLIERAF